jgi:hypothetical protein
MNSKLNSILAFLIINVLFIISYIGLWISMELYNFKVFLVFASLLACITLINIGLMIHIKKNINPFHDLNKKKREYKAIRNIRWSDFLGEFKPVINAFAKSPEQYFFDIEIPHDYLAAKSEDYRHVWTMFNHSEEPVIRPGFHLGKGVCGYYITKIPWYSEYISVILS